MIMNGATDQVDNAGANRDRGNGELHDADKSADNLKLNTDMGASTDDDEFSLSPRALIMEAKSSDDEMSVISTNTTNSVVSRQKWIEKINAKKPLSENTRKLLSRRTTPLKSSAQGSLSAKMNTRPRASLGGGGDDVLARARLAIESRKKSREMAKAKVTANIMALGGTNLSQSTSTMNDDAEVKDEVEGDAAPSTSHGTLTSPIEEAVEEEVAKVAATSSPEDGVKVKEACDQATASVEGNAIPDTEAANVGGKTPTKATPTKATPIKGTPTKNTPAGNAARANAQARLKATMAMLDARRKSAGRARIASNASSPLREHSTTKKEVNNAVKDVAEAGTGEQAGKTSTRDQSEAKVETERLEQERMLTEQKQEEESKQTSPRTPEKEKTEQRKLLAEQLQKEQEEGRRRAETKTALLEKKRLAEEAETSKKADAEKIQVDKIEQRRLLAAQLQKEQQEADRVAQAKTDRLEQERPSSGAEEAKQAEHVRLQKEKIEQRRLLAENLQKEQEEARMLAQVKAERLEKERFIAEDEAAKQDERVRLQEQKIEKRRLSAAKLQKEQKESPRLTQGKAERLDQERLMDGAKSAEQAGLERQEQEKIEQRRLLAEQLQKEQDEAHRVAQAKAKRFEQEKLATGGVTTEHADLEGLREEKNEQRRLLAEQLQKEEEEARRAAQAKAERLEQERLEQERLASEAEAARQTNLDRLQEIKMEQKRSVAEQLEREEEEARQWAKAKSKRLEEERLAAEAKAAKKSRLKREEQELIEQTRVLAEQLKRDEEEAALGITAKGDRLKQGRLSAGAKAETEDATSADDHQTFNLIGNKSSTCSDSAPIMENNSEASDAMSLGQVDRLLYQAKDEDDDHHDSSDDELFGEITNSMSDSEQSSAAGEMLNDDNTDFSPGPMWRKAAEEAELATALKNDFLPREAPLGREEIKPLAPIPSVETGLSSKGSRLNGALSQVIPLAQSISNLDSGQSNDEWAEETEFDEQEENVELGIKEWKGFQWHRMMYMFLLGIQLGLFPSIFAQSTCHFITGDAPVGEDGIEFGLYLGLQKFTPIDSAFQGHGYCQRYASDINYKPPILPHIAGVAATIFGTISLIVIGMYLRFSVVNTTVWQLSMWMLYLGFVCQISTFSIFLLDMCQDGLDCSMGPGAWMSAISAIVWFLLSLEMKINSPLYQAVRSSEGVVVIQKDSLTTQMKKSWQKFRGEDPQLKVPSLSRTAMKKQKQRVRKVETELGRYRAPEIV
mmetsp:Transcript_33208/g.71755  ORF Transcript_33208/g.71755 Transcript_33208/m.71755 type:complete len:1246 (+) Transcript_33208:156-3893(+)